MLLPLLLCKDLDADGSIAVLCFRIDVHSTDFTFRALLFLCNDVCRDAVGSLVYQHQHGTKSYSHQSECDTEPNKRAGLDLSIHAIRDGLTDGLETAESGSVANVSFLVLARAQA